MSDSRRLGDVTGQMLQALHIAPIAGSGDAGAEDGAVIGSFAATGWSMPSVNWLFGGGVAAQSLLAACATAPDRPPRSLSIRFIRQGRPSDPLVHEVTRVADSGTFSDRLVRSSVNGVTIASSTVLCHRPDDTPLAHHRPMPEVARVDPSRLTAGGAGFEFIDLCEPPLMSRQQAPSLMHLWMRAPDTPRSDQLANAAVLTMASDLFLTQSAWRPIEGYSIHDITKVMTFGLTFSLWYHRPVTFADWHLVEIDTPVAAAGRSLNYAHWYTADGDLVASVVLDSVMRIRR